MILKLKNIIGNIKKVVGVTVGAAVVVFCLASGEALAIYSGVTPDSTIDPTLLIIDEQKFLGTKIDKELEFIDVDGNEFKFKDLQGKATLFLLSYYKCDGACPSINRDLLKHIEAIDRIKPGEYYNVLTASFDANDDMMSLKHFTKEIGIPSDMKGWRTSILKNKEDIKKLTDSIGYKYFWSKADKTFVHPSVFILISPEGRVIRYLYSALIDEKDMELALVDANNNKATASVITDFTDIFLVACYSYNYKEGKYTINYPVFISSASLLLGVSLIVVSLTVYKNKGKKEVKS